MQAQEKDGAMLDLAIAILEARKVTNATEQGVVKKYRDIVGKTNAKAKSVAITQNFSGKWNVKGGKCLIVAVPNHVFVRWAMDENDGKILSLPCYDVTESNVDGTYRCSFQYETKI